MDIVELTNESNFSSKFKRESNRKQKSTYTFEDGEMWVEVLLAQLTPTPLLFSADLAAGSSDEPIQTRFDAESDLARILMEIGQRE